ncbi:MAG: SIS domain-containing protein, partial [Hyphomicrobiales bacterium]|nr:SIS domain-containing protein [Hyphomicrobiales bacterium]
AGLVATPGAIAEALKAEPEIEAIAHRVARARDVLFLGRGLSYVLALEGALKFKELTYLHAEGYPAGELKHGPIALVDEDVPVIVIAPDDGVREKTASNLQEVAARGGRIVLIGDEAAAGGVPLEARIAPPACAADFTPLVGVVALQLLAYHAAVFMGKDADQPRNLAKSVTVE